MKTTPINLLAGLALVTAAQAGTPSMAPPPAPSAGLWQWFAGGSVGYLTELDEAMYNLQVGAEYKAPGAQGAHAIYLEVGFTQDDADYFRNPAVYGAGSLNIPTSIIGGGRTEAASIDLNIIPITLNYKYEAPISGRLNYYLGLGLGIAILDSSYDWSWSQAIFPNGQGVGSDDQTEVRFYGDVFAGLAYEVNPSFEVFAGVRYIFMDNVDHPIDVAYVPAYEAGINNDLLIELGARFKF